MLMCQAALSTPDHVEVTRLRLESPLSQEQGGTQRSGAAKELRLLS